MGCNRKALVALIGSVFMVGTTQVLAGPSASAMANTCAGCHGTNGQSVGPASPNLAGMSESYFIDSMMGFKALPKGKNHAEDARPATIMQRIAKGYTVDAVLHGGLPERPSRDAEEDEEAGQEAQRRRDRRRAALLRQPAVIRGEYNNGKFHT